MSDNRDNSPPGIPLHFLTYQISSSATDEHPVVDSRRALDGGDIPELCELLKDGDMQRRLMAANALMHMGAATNAAVPRLIDLLKEPQESTRRCAIEILSHLGPAAEPAIPALRAALKDPSDLIGRWSALALGEIGPPAKEASTDLLELRFHSTDVKTRAIAWAALKKIDPVAAISHALVREENAGGEICRFFGHSTWVNSVALSPDGRWALSASGQPSDISQAEADFSIRLWDVEHRREQRRLLGHADRVSSVVFFQDGTRCLSGSFDATVRIWDLEQGREVRCFRGHSDRVKAVAVSPDGRYILSGSCDRTVRMWDVQTGRELYHLQKHQHWVVSVAFAPDGKHVLSGSLDGTARLWDAKKGREIAGRGGGWFRGLWSHLGRSQVNRAPGSRAAITSVAFHPHGPFALSGSTDNTLRVWDIDTGKVIRQFQGHTAGVTSVAFSADGRSIASGSTDRTLRLWDVATGEELQRFEGHTDVVTSVALSPDGRFALSGSADKTVRLWRLPAPGP